MRYLSLCLLTIGLVVKAAENQPASVSVPLKSVFSVEGYDDNDRVQLTIEGTLPTTCFKVAASKVEVDAKSREIRIAASAYQYEGNCLRIPVNYTDVVTVGLVPAGEYQVVDQFSKKALGQLTVTKATRPEADEFLYAALDDAYIHNDGRTNFLVLRGRLTDSCTQVKEVKVNYTRNAIIVQPIVERTGENCETVNVPFTKQTALPTSLMGSYLLHARSMNGQAVNKLIGLY